MPDDYLQRVLSNPLVSGEPAPEAPKPVIAPDVGNDSTSTALADIQASPLVGGDTSIYLRRQLQKERTWEDVAPELQDKYGVDPETVRQHYQLEESRAVQKGEGMTPHEALVRRSIPFYSEIHNEQKAKEYTDATARFNEGKASKEDAQTIARFERLQQIDAEMGKSFQGKAVQALGSAPAMVGEIAGAGKALGLAGRGLGLAPRVTKLGQLGRTALQTAATPSMYLSNAVNNNIEAGRSADDTRGLPAAYGLGLANMLIIGRVQAKAGGMSAIAPVRIGAAGGIGVAEQAVVDYAGGLADEFLAKGNKTNTKYGTIGSWAHGEGGEARQHAAIQFLTFATFAGMHGRPEAAQKVFDTAKEAVDAAKPQQVDDTAQAVSRNADRVLKAIERNPALTREQAATLFQDDPPGKVLDSALAFVDAAIPETPKATKPRVDGQEATRDVREIRQPESAPAAVNDESLRAADASPVDRPDASAPAVKLAAGPDHPLKTLADTELRQLGDFAGVPKSVKGREKLLEAIDQNAGVVAIGRKMVQENALAEARAPKPASELPASIERAKDGHFVAIDTDNMGGLVKNLGERQATNHQREMLNIAHEELSKAGEVRLHKANDKPSDEHVAIVSADKPAIDQAMARARERITKLNAERGVKNIERVSEKAGPREPGLTHFAEPIQGRGRAALEGEAGAGLETAKVRRSEEPKPKSAVAELFRRKGDQGLGKPVAGAGQPLQGRVGKVAPPAPPPRPDADVLKPRDVFVMRELAAGRSMANLAKQLGMSKEGVRQIQVRAHEKFGTPELSKEKDREVASRLAKRIADGGKVSVDEVSVEKEAEVLDVLKVKWEDEQRLQREVARAEAQIKRLERRGKNTDDERQVLEVLRAGIERLKEGTRGPEGRQPEAGGAAEGLPQQAAGPPASKVADSKAADVAARGPIEPQPIEPKAGPARSPWQEQQRIEREAKEAARQEQIRQQRIQNLGKARVASAEGTGNAWLAEEVRLEQEGTETVGAYIRRGRRLDPASLDGDVVQHLKESGAASVLADKGGNAADTMAAELHRAGILPEDSARDPVDQMVEAILNNSPVRESSKTGERKAEANLKVQQENEAARQAALTPEERAKEEAARELEKEKPLDEMERNEGSLDFDFGEPQVADVLKSEFKDRTTGMGAANAIPKPQAEMLDAAGRKWHQSLRDFVRKLGGAKFANTRRLSEAAADAGANVDRSRLLGEAQAELANDAVFLPGQQGTSIRMIAGAVLNEMQLRHTRDYYFNLAAKASKAKDYAKASEYGEIGRNVGTVIGADPLPREVDFHHWSTDPEILDILARADRFVSPTTEKLFREATGMEPGDEIHSGSMIDKPGIPKLSIVALREGDLTAAQKIMGVLEGNPMAGEPGRGNLRRHQAVKLGASKQRTGSAEHGYESDLGEIIRRNLVDRQVNADKNQFFRTWQKEGVGRLMQPGDRPGDGWRKIEQVKPYAKDGKSDFWVKDDVYADARQLLEPKELKWKLPVFAAATWANLRSTADFVSHSKNLLSNWVRGARLRDMWDGMRGQIVNDPTVRKEIVELARLSALSDRHLDVGTGLGRLDPSRYASRVLGIMDRAVRISSLRAYNRALQRGLRVENTDSGRRDFINQIGNYSKLTQNRMVALLRDLGIGPFATAGTTFWVHGLRTLTLRTGMRTTSTQAQVQLQAEMLARLVAFAAIVPVINQLMWGRADGDDLTPWGSIKLSADKGKTHFLNITNLIGLDRGVREVGLKAVIEGSRPGAKKAGATPGSIADNARRDITSAIAHPILGPGAQMLSVAATGKDVMGFQKSHVLSAEEKKKGESQAMYDALAAIFESNSLLETWIRHPFEKHVLGVKPTPAQLDREPTPVEKASRTLLGPFGIQRSMKPPGAPQKR